MFVLHVALQGCLRGGGVAFGLTADTGGHIRYLLDLVAASAQDAGIERIVMATRCSTASTAQTTRARRADLRQVELVRLASASPGLPFEGGDACGSRELRPKPSRLDRPAAEGAGHDPRPLRRRRLGGGTR